MRKKILFICLASTMLSLTACGDKDVKETTPSLEVIHPTEPQTQPETIADKLEEPKTLTVETAPAPMSIEIDENGNVVEESSQPSDNAGTGEENPNTPNSDIENGETPGEEKITSEQETRTPEEESKMAEENAAKREAIEESVSESIQSDENALTASDYERLENAIEEYNKKEAEEVLKNMPPIPIQ